MSHLQIHQFPCRSDNYGVLLHAPDAKLTAAIDAPDEAAVKAALDARGWQLTHIFTTHHHADHTQGNLPLKNATGCTIIGPAAESDRIPGIDQAVSEGDKIAFGDITFEVLETPGHTAGHISYVIPDAGLAFVGDTMFSMGCGRLFEGDAETMWASLQKLMQLPPDTRIYCGHEYTAANARFALTIEPENEVLRARAKEVFDLRDRGEPTLPTTLAQERATNPFLRAAEPSIRKNLGMSDAEDWQVFAEIRQRKDRA